jgi:hypothetical protein
LVDLLANNHNGNNNGNTWNSLSTVRLENCSFSHQEEIQLLAAFEADVLLTKLDLSGFTLKGAAIGNSLADVLENAPNLQTLTFENGFGVGETFDQEALRALQPGLQSNRTLKELCLTCCLLKDEHLGLDALVGNTTMNT